MGRRQGYGEGYGDGGSSLPDLGRERRTIKVEYKTNNKK
jgi:hypothetical protein